MGEEVIDFWPSRVGLGRTWYGASRGSVGKSRNGRSSGGGRDGRNHFVDVSLSKECAFDGGSNVVTIKETIAVSLNLFRRPANPPVQNTHLLGTHQTMAYSGRLDVTWQISSHLDIHRLVILQAIRTR